ncbi:MAG: Lipopolysaccharide heptosyltransferase 1 [Syntrophomonadaceae bacterium]|nr:Lipopolysaccharide heptosyltransferase 1 [Bacillota bacterium]
MNFIFKKYFKLIRRVLISLGVKRIGWRAKLTQAVKFFYYGLMFLVEVFGDALFFWKRFKKIKIQNPKKILIIKIDQYGDVLFSTFLLPLIKKRFPKVEIHYLIHPKTLPVLKNNPLIDKIFFWHDIFLYFLLGRADNRSIGFKKAIKIDSKTLRDLRREQYDVVINTRAYMPSSNIFWKLIGARYLLSFDVSEQSFLADYLADYDFAEEEWKNFLKLLDAFDFGKFETEKFDYSPGFYNFEENELGELKNKKKIVVMAPISYDKDRLWPIEKWAEICRFCLKKGYSVILVGLKEHENYLEKISLLVDSKKIKIIADLSIPQLAGLIKKSSLFVCIDSFPAHLAIALGKPTICFVNVDFYYLKGYSPKVFIGGRSMIPLVENVKIFSLKAKSEEVINFLRFPAS